MYSSYQQWLAERLEDRRTQRLYRHVKTLDSAQGTRVSTEGKSLANFSSNDYLSLANHPNVVASYIEGAQCYGVGSGASHLISGHSEAHEKLATLIAEWTGREAAVLFSSGYMANLAVLNTLVGKGDLVVHDKLNHASLIDGVLSSQATQKRFPHKNIDSLVRQLHGDFRYKWLVTDGVFSMDGDIAPLPDYLSATMHESPLLFVDDAHGFGVLGDTGAGTVEHFQLTSSDVPVLMGTLGKAIGTSGAFVAGDQLLIDNLTQFARSYIYTTALPPAVAHSSVTAIQMIKTDPALRQSLKNNIGFFKETAKRLGVPIVHSDTAIQLVLVNDDSHCMTIAQALMTSGFWVGAIRPPTVPAGSARLRITLNRNHSFAEIESLLVALKAQLKKHAPELIETS